MDDLDKVLDEALNEWQTSYGPKPRTSAASQMAPPVQMPAGKPVAPLKAAEPEAAPEAQLNLDTILDQELQTWRSSQTGPSVPPQSTAPVDPGGYELEPVAPEVPAVPSRSLLDAAAGGFKRSWKNLLSTPDTLRGIYAEATGDPVEAAARAQAAAAIQATAPQQMQEFKSIADLEDVAVWAAEKFGEFAPTMLSIFTGAGAGAAAGQLAARGLLSSVATRTMLTKAGAIAGSSATMFGVETADIGSELRKATGSYHPAVSATGGAAAAALEMVVPFGVGRALFGGKEFAKTIPGAIGKGMVLEGATETAQEAVALGAREYADPNFDIFTPESGWRLAEAGAAGALVGGPFGGIGRAVSGPQEKPGSERLLTPEEVAAASEPQTKGFLSWFRSKFEDTSDPRKDQIKQVMRANPELDAVEAGTLIDIVGIHWAAAGIDKSQTAAVGEFIESQTKRYAHPLEPKKLMNSTDFEDFVSKLPPETIPTEGVIEVDEGSLVPIAVTADFEDLPTSASDPRVFYLPGTSQREKQQLASDFDKMWSLSSAEAIESEYSRLLNNGLRVIPSYGASFKYAGKLKGKSITRLPASGRSFATIGGSAIDLNRFKPGEAIGMDHALMDRIEYINTFNFPPEYTTDTEKAAVIAQTFEEVGRDRKKLLEKLHSKGIWKQAAPSDTVILTINQRQGKASVLKNNPAAIAGTSTLVTKSLSLAARAVQKSDTTAWVENKKDGSFTELKEFYFKQIVPVLQQLKVPLPREIKVEDFKRVAGDYTAVTHSIRVNPAVSDNILHTLLHEVGHHVTIYTWQNLSAEQQQEVWNSYRRHTLQYVRKRGQVNTVLIPENVNYLKTLDSANDPHYSAYVTTFVEYLTEQWVRWYRTDPAHKQAFNTIDKLIGVYNKNILSNLENIPWLKHGLYPDYTITGWMELIKSEGKSKQELSQLAAKVRLPSNHPIGEMTASELGKTIEEYSFLFPETWQTLVSDELGEGNLGITISAKQTTLIALAAMELDAKGIIVHEAVHAVRNLFTPAEWASLLQAAREVPGLRAQIYREWHGIYTKQARELFPTDETRQKIWLSEALAEESVAVLMQMHSQGLPLNEAARGPIARLVEFFVRFADNLRTRLGWINQDVVVRQFFRGEIASRQQRSQIQEIYQRWMAAEEPAPVDVTRAGPNLWVAIYKEKTDQDHVYAAQYRFYTNAATEPTGTPADKFNQLSKSAQGVGVAFLSHNSKGYEVDYVKVRKEFQKQGFAKQFYKFIEADLNMAMKPSGILLPDGYQMWLRRDAHAVRYHVYDEIDETWLSPNYVRGMVQFIDSATGKKQPGYAAERTRWQNLYAKIKPEAWLDPELEKMFALAPKAAVYGQAFNLTEKELRHQDRLITGENNTSLGFEEAMGENMETAARNNARELGVEPGLGTPPQMEFRYARNLTKWNQLTPEQKRLLRGTMNEADRIGWFSKLWLGIHQMAWKNPDNFRLQNYVQVIEQWAAKTEGWINRADTTARDWEHNSGLTKAEKARFADMLFYITEMQYRTAAEKLAGTVRKPTPQELAAILQQFQLQQNALALYQRIEQDFSAFLDDIEQVSRRNIQRQFASQRSPTGVPGAAEAKALAELTAEMVLMRQKPYFPMTRFGEWTLSVRDPYTGNIQAFYTFESLKERNAYIRTAARQWPGTDLQVGRMPAEAMEFLGIPGPLLVRIKAELPGLTATQKEWIDKLGNHLAPERSFRKRWIERKETPGYSLDAFRVFANYFQTGSRYLARLEYKDQAQEEINSLRREANNLYKDTAKSHEMADFMQKHLNYMLEGGRDWSKTRSFIAIWHLGFSPVAAAMNLTQVPMVTMPYLNSLFGIGPSFRALFSLHSALKQMWGGVLLNPRWPGYNKAHEELQRVGKIDAGQAPELAAYASANNLYKTAVGDAASRALRTTAQTSMWMFQKAERFNRELTFTMAFKLAMENQQSKIVREVFQNRGNEISDLISRLRITPEEAVATIIAKDAIDRTHGIYAPWARPQFMRNSLGQLILVFFTYVQMMLFAMRHNPGNVQMLLMLVFLAGVMGLPGMDDLDKIIEAVARRLFGKDFSLSRTARKFVLDITEGTMLKDTGPDLLLHGISRFGFGAGLLPQGWAAPRFDVSQNMSMGRLVPGLGEAAKAWGTYKDWQDIMANSTQQASGAGFGILFSLMQFMASNPLEADAKKWEKIMQRQMKAMARATRYYTTGKETNRAGARFVDFDVNDPSDMATIVAQFLGATPAKLTMKYEASSAMRETVDFYRGRQKVIYEQLFKALRENDQGAIADIFKDIDRYNADVRTHMNGDFSSLGINPNSLKSSLRNRTRGQALFEADLPGRKSEVPVYQGIQEMYPLVYEKRVK